MLNGGRIAGSQSCCCENPPPPACYDCPSFCSYLIQLLQPEELATSTVPMQSCDFLQSVDMRSLPYMFKDLFPEGTTFDNDNQGDYRASYGVVGAGFGGDAYVEHGASGLLPVESLLSECGITANTVSYSTQSSISFKILCYTNNPQSYFLRVSSYVNVDLGVFLGNFCRGKWSWFAEGTFPLDSTCISAPDRHCDTSYTSQFRFLNLPIEVTADGETTSLGDYSPEYTDTITYPDFALSETAASLGEALRDAITATFRITARENCLPLEPEELCPCNCSGSGFDFCDGSETIDLSYASGCDAPYDTVTQYDIPCTGIEFADFSDIKAYFGTAAQGYPFSYQWLKDSAIELYDNETCSFAIHQCWKVRVSSSRCMRGDECICLNGSVTSTIDYYVQFFDCELEEWVDITDDILTENRTVAYSPGNVLGPANNCSDCEFDNGNPPEPPPDPGPCDYDITAGECENITGNFP